MRVEHIGDATLYLGDCRDILPTLPKVDAVITDPPYGIGGSWGSASAWRGNCGKSRLWQGEESWDVRPDSDLLRWITEQPSVVWGGNYFPGLPTAKGWLVWNKCADTTQAQAELAWSNIPANVRVYSKSPLGVFGNGGANGEFKEHPTQKPVGLMIWCIEQAGNPQSILDPFMGSGTTGVACAQLGCKFIGIERESKYFDIACRRIEQAYAQGRLFDEPAAKPEQEALPL